MSQTLNISVGVTHNPDPPQCVCALTENNFSFVLDLQGFAGGFGKSGVLFHCLEDINECFTLAEQT